HHDEYHATFLHLHIINIISLFNHYFFFFQAEDGIRDATVTGVQTCALPISTEARPCCGQTPRSRPRRPRPARRRPPAAPPSTSAARPWEALPAARRTVPPASAWSLPRTTRLPSALQPWPGLWAAAAALWGRRLSH